MTTEQITPPDQAARDRIREQHDQTLFVEAGAGSGKTTSLVERIVALVTAGTQELRDIAAITFTEAAAAQLRERIRSTLEAALVDPQTSAATGATLARAISQIDEAAIVTLHGFAQQVLASHLLEAGLPPEFAVLDELDTRQWFDEAWQLERDRMLADPALATALTACDALGLTMWRLDSLALAFAHAHDRLAAAEVFTPPPMQTVTLQQLIAQLREAHSWAQWCTQRDELFDHLENLGALAQQLDGADHTTALRIAGARHWRCHRGRAANWDGHAADIKASLKELDAQREAFLHNEALRALMPIAQRLREWSLRISEQRRVQGQLTFHDLLVRARDVLVTQPAVCRDVRARWRVLFIDEFQDTDPLQLEIALALAGPEHAGRLCFVGDPKQSIYRFRRADIALYHHARAQFADGHVPLTATFRAVPDVVAWVNAIFEQLLDGQHGQAPFQALQAVRGALPDNKLAVSLIGGPSEAATMADLRAEEMASVAAAVRSIRDEQWPVAEHNGQTRVATYADIAILLPTRTALPELERALADQNVPYRVEASSLVYNSQEVRELIALLRAIDDPADEIAVVAALRSPALGCSDVDLVTWANSGGGWDYRHPSGPPGLVAQAMVVLQGLHEARRTLDPAALLHQLVTQRQLFAIALARPRPRDSWRRMRFVLDEARAFAEGGGSLRDLITRLQRQAADAVRVTEQVLPDEDDDAVRILTVHAAKGLEFPITVLAGLGAKPRSGSAGPLLWTEQGKAEVHVSEFLATPGFPSAAEKEQAAENQERIRLLYVAATRAQDHLVVALHHRPANKGRASNAEILWQHAQHFPELARVWQPDITPAATAAADNQAIPTVDQDAWLAQRNAAMATRASAAIFTATRLSDSPLSEEAEPEQAQTDDTDDVNELPPFRRGRAGTSLGRAVHATLQSVDLPNANTLEQTARAQADAEGLSARADEVAALCRAALQSAAVQEALAGKRWWRELPVVAHIDGALLEGYVDLLFEDHDGQLVLVDYKTDREIPDTVTGRYRIQLGAYALAVEAITGRPVTRAALVYLKTDGAHTRWLDDVADAAQDARARMQAQLLAT